jgi:hypothetical protein
MSDKPRVNFKELAWAFAFAHIRKGQKLHAGGVEYLVAWKHFDPDWVQLTYREGKKKEERVVRKGDPLLLELRPE